MQDALNAIAEKDRQKVVDAIEAALQPGSGGNYEVEYCLENAQDHQQHTVIARGKALFGKGNIVYRFSGILQDITEQEAARSKIAEAEEHTRLAVESARLGTFEVDIETDKVICSKKFRDIFGLSQEDVLHSEFVAAIHPDDRPVRDMAAESALVKGTIDYDLRVTWLDQSIHWISLSGKVFYDENRKPLKMLGTVMDITVQKMFLAGFQESNRKFVRSFSRQPLPLLFFAGLTWW